MHIREIYVDRFDYVEQCLAAGRQNSITLITGMRGSGKSSILKLIREELRNACIPSSHVITMTPQNYLGIDTLLELLPPDAGYSGAKVYLLFDDIHQIEKWPELLNMLVSNYNCKIYAVCCEPLKSFLKEDTWLAENCAEIEVFTLSLGEFVVFHGYQMYRKPVIEISETSKRPSDKYTTYDSNGMKISEEALIKRFFDYGGFPQVSSASHHIILTYFRYNFLAQNDS